MAKYRIVQVKPLGLDYAFNIEEFVIVPARYVVNEKYEYMQSYYNQQGKLNAGGLPLDYNIQVPEKQSWKDMGNWYARNTLKQAEKVISDLRIINNLQEDLKTFKKVVIKEYD